MDDLYGAERPRSSPAPAPIHLDGSMGEGGGQIIRSALALSVITGRPFTVERVRAGRAKPGLRAQHTVCVEAAARISSAYTEDVAAGSTAFAFTPNQIVAGRYRFAIGTAGSTTLVLQTLLPALLHADGPSAVVIEGGTHNAHAPPYEFLADAFAPQIRRLGAGLDTSCARYGFYPRGGGEIAARITPPGAWSPLHLHHRGALRSRDARALVVGVPAHVAERELREVRRTLDWPEPALTIDDHGVAAGSGNALLLRVCFEHVTEVVSALGERGVRAEEVGARASREMQRYLDTDAPVGEHLADQLLLPLAVGAGGSFVTGPLSLHSTTNIAVIQHFLKAQILTDDLSGGRIRVTVQGMEVDTRPREPIQLQP